ncbi:amino acid permease [Nocardioides convexus]|uniref:amino acid permease n=1 Tax=Nocardioides convexus TaxID=2712224 RepID=UPI0031010390
MLGRAAGFSLFLMNALSLTMIIGVIALGTGEYLAAAFSGANSKWVGVVVIVVCSGVAVLNIRTNAWITGVFLALEMVAVVVVCALGFANVSRPVSTLWDAQTIGDHGTLVGVGLGLIAGQTATALFAYNGYGAAIYFAEETHGARKVMGKVVLVALAVTVAAEILPLTAVLLGAPDMARLVGADNPMEYFMESRGSHGVNVAVSLAIAIAIINATVAIILQAGRTLFSAARDRAFPDPVSRLFGYVHPTLQTPPFATLFVGLVAATLAAFVPIASLITSTGATLVALYVFVALSALVGRRTGATGAAEYRMPLFPLPPVIIVIALAYVTYEVGKANLWQIVIALGALAVGFLYYLAYLRPRSADRWTMLSAAPEEILPGESRPRRDRQGDLMPLDHPLRKRARDHGLPLDGEPGAWNAITDVPGVEVGYTTLVEGSGALDEGHGPVRTGVTAILPLGREGVGTSCAAGFHSLNGNGETHRQPLAGGVRQPRPAGRDHQHPRRRSRPPRRPRLVAAHQPRDQERLAPAGGRRDLGRLPQRHQRRPRPAPPRGGRPRRRDLRSARGGLGRRRHRDELLRLQGRHRHQARARCGSVATPTPSACSCRRTSAPAARLTVAGRKVGREHVADNPMEDSDWLAPPGAGSCIGIVATDAPLLPGQCKALARRVPLGLARTGTTGSHFSGDIFLAFSTANRGALDSAIGPAPERLSRMDFLPWGAIDPLYEAVVQASEESVLNALVAAQTMTGRDGHRSPGFPVSALAGPW